MSGMDHIAKRHPELKNLDLADKIGIAVRRRAGTGMVLACTATPQYNPWVFGSPGTPGLG